MSVEYEGKTFEVITNDDGLLTLDLFEEEIDDLSKIKGLDQLTDLQRLDLGGNAIQEICCLENLTSLQELSLASNQLTKLSGLDFLEDLEKLDLSKNQLTSTKGLEHLTNLKSLNLAWNKIPWKEMTGVASLVNLKELDINHNLFDKVALEEVGGHIYGKVKSPQRLVEYFRDLKAGKPMAKPSMKPAPKPASKPVAKMPAKVEAKPANKPATKLQMKPATKPAAKLQMKPATKPAAKLQMKPAAKPASKAETKAATKVELKPTPKTATKPEAKPAPNPAQQPAAKPSEIPPAKQATAPVADQAKLKEGAQPSAEMSAKVRELLQQVEKDKKPPEKVLGKALEDLRKKDYTPEKLEDFLGALYNSLAARTTAGNDLSFLFQKTKKAAVIDFFLSIGKKIIKQPLSESASNLVQKLVDLVQSK